MYRNRFTSLRHRFNMMRAVVTVSIALTYGIGSIQTAIARKPNFVIVMADDMN